MVLLESNVVVDVVVLLKSESFVFAVVVVDRTNVVVRLESRVVFVVELVVFVNNTVVVELSLKFSVVVVENVVEVVVVVELC